jgi:hypothetical protein
LLDILANRFASLSDAQLRKQGSIQNEHRAGAHDVAKAARPEALLEFFKPMKALFSDQEWDGIVAGVTKLQASLDVDD